MNLEEKIGGAFERRKGVRRLSKHPERGWRGNTSCRNNIRPRFPSHGVSRSASPTHRNVDRRSPLHQTNSFAEQSPGCLEPGGNAPEGEGAY
ncbi:hypothetical protein BD410DRAFT_797360, partial [Rickenella mellea]